MNSANQFNFCPVLSELLERLQKRIDLEQDNVRCYPISSHTLGQVVILGSVPLYEPPSSYVV